jgi:hypothetical protein
MFLMSMWFIIWRSLLIDALIMRLCRCLLCRFLPEKLSIHQRSCTADNPSRRVTDPVARGGGTQQLSSSSSSRMNSTNSGSNNMDMEYAPTAIAGFNQCPTCGRRFNDLAYEKYVQYKLLPAVFTFILAECLLKDYTKKQSSTTRNGCG